MIRQISLCPCGDIQCFGCDMTPAMAGSGDSRDYTAPPPALLDPAWVLRMRSRIKQYDTNGDLCWVPFNEKKGN